MKNDSENDAPRQAIIPGAYERNTLMHRQPGSIGGSPYGSDDVPIGPSLMAPATIADRQMEGGGGVSQRPRTLRMQSHADPKHTQFERGSPLTRGYSWFRALLAAR
jgi:hypothetical protein